MDKISSKFQNLIFNLIYTSFVFSLIYILGLVIGLKLNIILQILVVSLVSLAVKFFLLNPLILYALLATGFLGAILVHRFITPIFFTLGERVFYLFENILNNLQGEENIASDNVLLFWGILVILVSFFTAFILFKGKSIYLLLPVYIGSFLYYWYNFFDQAYWMISIFLLIFFVLMGLDNYSKERIEVDNSTNYNFEELYTPWLKTAAMYSILIVSIALLLPKNNNYIVWPWLQQKIYTTFPIVEKLRSYDSYNRKSGKASLFDFSITGYQGDTSRLGGPVNLSDKKIMTVHADSSSYLRGNVRHIYTGDSWETITEPSKNYRLNQDFSGLSQDEQKIYYKQTQITITNHSFASTTLFSPYKATKVNFKDNYILKVNRDDALFFPNGIYDGESYIVQVQKPLSYGMLVALGMDKKKKDIADLEIYLQTPKNKITERTKALVKEIVKDANSDFQKAVAIENHLRNNYKYNLNVDEVPENKEFIDYFLFDEKEGYCTYYATSMAIMLRLEGIPSRYIEGYLAQDSVEKGIYEVRHKNAHAWVEAFIEPVGWMAFEPTPAYSIQPRLENYSPHVLNEDTYLSETGENSRSLERSIEGHMIEGDFDFVSSKKNPNYKKTYKDILVDLQKNIADIFIIILILIIPVRFLIGFLRYRWQEAQAKKLSNNERIIYLYKQILKLTELLGYPQQYGETHYEYANRVAYKFYIHNEKGIKEITDIFVKSKYSNSPASDEDVLELEMYRNTLKKRLRNHYGPIVYYYRKYVRQDI